MDPFETAAVRLENLYRSQTHAPDWACAEQLARSLPQSRIWKLSGEPVNGPKEKNTLFMKFGILLKMLFRPGSTAHRER